MAENAEITVYLDHLIEQLGAEIKRLQGLASDAGTKDRADLVRNICLASRSAYSEYLALHIDRVFGAEDRLTQLYALHLAALAELEKIEKPTARILEFVASISQRRDDLNTIRRNTLTGELSGTSG